MVPSEIQRINLLKEGFRVTFTRPWTGQPPPIQTTTRSVKPTSALLSEDGLSVHLKLPELLPEKIYEFRIDGLRTRTGNAITHPLAFYTLNRLLKWSRRTADQAVHILTQLKRHRPGGALKCHR